MSEKLDASITIQCPSSLKRDMKTAILDKEIDSFQDGYLEILKLGLEQFKKGGKAK